MPFVYWLSHSSVSEEAHINLKLASFNFDDSACVNWHEELMHLNANFLGKLASDVKLKLMSLTRNSL